MIGSIIGDIVGSVYEFGNIKTKEFEFFSEQGREWRTLGRWVATEEDSSYGLSVHQDRMISALITVVVMGLQCV